MVSDTRKLKSLQIPSRVQPSGFRSTRVPAHGQPSQGLACSLALSIDTVLPEGVHPLQFRSCGLGGVKAKSHSQRFLRFSTAKKKKKLEKAFNFQSEIPECEVWVPLITLDKLHVTTSGHGTQAQASGQLAPSPR